MAGFLMWLRQQLRRPVCDEDFCYCGSDWDQPCVKGLFGIDRTPNGES